MGCILIYQFALRFASGRDAPVGFWHSPQNVGQELRQQGGRVITALRAATTATATASLRHSDTLPLPRACARFRLCAANTVLNEVPSRCTWVTCVGDARVQGPAEGPCQS